MMEARHPNVRSVRWENFDAMTAARTPAAMSALILGALPEDASIVRVHVGGDFYNVAYRDAWFAVAMARPAVLFYAYTKAVNLFVGVSVPANLILTASEGGRFDSLIPSSGLRTARVVYSEAEARALGLEIDHDDTHAQRPGPSFALLIHGSQPAGSDASRAVSALQKAKRAGA